MADGSYGSYTFDDANSGTQIITVKKAIASDHGTDTGWLASYGDGQAVFGSFLLVTDYLVFDGATRNDSDWDNGSAYGFKTDSFITNTAWFGNASDNITIRYVEIGGTYGLSWSSGIPDAGIYFGGFDETADYWTISHCFIHNVGIVGQMAGVTNITWEYNWMGLNWSKEIVRGQNIARNVTFKNNILKDGCRADCPSCEGCTAEIALFANQGDSPDFNGFQAYGNIIWKTTGTYNSDGAILAECTDNTCAIYNNTVVNNGTGTARLATNGVGYVRNNIWYLTGGMTSGCEAATCDNNGSYTSSSPFINASSGNFSLNESLVGTTLNSPYNTDMFGNIRGTDGVWDRGALEYVSGSSGDTTAPANPAGLIVR